MPVLWERSLTLSAGSKKTYMVRPLNQRIISRGVVSSLEQIRQYENITMIRKVHSFVLRKRLVLH